MHFYAWKAGLKTGMYYLRSQPAAEAIKFTVRSRKKPRLDGAGIDDINTDGGQGEAAASCTLGHGGPDCEACSG